MTVDIALGFRHYSSEELQNYANLGLISCNGVDLMEFVEKILEGMYSQDDFEAEQEKAEEASNALEEAREKVREVVGMLERI